MAISTTCHSEKPLDACAAPAISARRSGFTLIQLLMAISIIALLSAVLMGVIGRARATARRSHCDVQLKEITLALDTYRQETGRMPQVLSDLATKKYISPQTLRCPGDPELGAQGDNPGYSTYADFYLIREPRDSGELPVLVCPHHNADGGHGVQAYKGRFTAQFTSRPAFVTSSDVTGTVLITSPEKGLLTLPTPGKTLQLRGGDRVKTGAGTVTINFADGSHATVQPNSEMRILDTYIEGHRSGPLYTLTRQFSGRIDYYVNPGSRFDVATPTATAGALGTRFSVELLPDAAYDANSLPETQLTVFEHTVALSTASQTVEVVPADGAYLDTADPAAAAPDPVTGEPTKKRKKRSPRQRAKGRNN